MKIRVKRILCRRQYPCLEKDWIRFGEIIFTSSELCNRNFFHPTSVIIMKPFLNLSLKHVIPRISLEPIENIFNCLLNNQIQHGGVVV